MWDLGTSDGIWGLWWDLETLSGTCVGLWLLKLKKSRCSFIGWSVADGNERDCAVAKVKGILIALAIHCMLNEAYAASDVGLLLFLPSGR